MLVAAGLTAMMLIHTEAEPPSHPGTATATVVSADSRIEATIYRIDPLTSFGPMTEVTLGLTAAGIAHDEVTLGCTEDDDGLSIVEVRFITADTLMLRNYNGDEQTIKFNPQTLQPASTIGHC
jgi:hypothetical protein